MFLLEGSLLFLSIWKSGHWWTEVAISGVGGGQGGDPHIYMRTQIFSNWRVEKKSGNINKELWSFSLEKKDENVICIQESREKIKQRLLSMSSVQSPVLMPHEKKKGPFPKE